MFAGDCFTEPPKILLKSSFLRNNGEVLSIFHQAVNNDLYIASH